MLFSGVHRSSVIVQFGDAAVLTPRSMEPVIFHGRRQRTDVLSSVLQTVRMHVAVFFNNVAHSEWVTETPDASEFGRYLFPEAEIVIPFHIITAGSCWAELTEPFRAPSVMPEAMGRRSW